MDTATDGSSKAPILIISASPDRYDLAEGRPLVGPPGRLLWSVLKRAGIQRDDCLTLNVIGELAKKYVKAVKVDGKYPEGTDSQGYVLNQDGTRKTVPADAPSTWQIAKWWDEFDRVVGKSRAKVAICLGGVAFERLTGILSFERKLKRRSGIEGWRGYLVTPQECRARDRQVDKETVYKSAGKTKDGKVHKKGDPRKVKVREVAEPVLPSQVEWIVPTLDPGGVMRSGLKTLPAIKVDVDRAARGARGELKLTTVKFEEYPVILGGEVVVVDIETPANPLESNLILRVGAATHEGAWSDHWNPQSRLMLRDLCADPSTLKVLHNHAFDRPRLEAYDVVVRGKVRDTMLMAALAQPDLYKGLNSVASLYLDGPRWKHRSEESPALYNAWDCVKTLHIHDALEMELQKTSQLGLLDSTIMPGSEVLMRMGARGIKLDQGARYKWVQELQVQVERSEVEWREKTGVNPRAPTKVREWMDSKGVPRLDSAYSKYGGVTSDASALRDVLKWCADQPEGRYEGVHDAVRALLAHRESSKLLSTYTSYPLDDDSCVHPSYLPGAKDDDNEVTGKGLAGTWRITSREPNFQNIPAEAKHMFVPHHSDLTFVEADFGQIELRIAASLSGDDVLQAALAQTDVFKDLTEFLHVDRTRAKNVLYGSLYGAGPRTLVKVFRAQNYPITEKECRDLQAGIAARYPKLWAWRDRVKEIGQAQFHLTNPYGLRRYFYNRNDVPAMIDFLPQSTAAIIMWQTLRELAEDLKTMGGWIVNTVHDSVLCEVPKGRIPQAVALIKSVMEQPRREMGGLEVPVKVMQGENWGSLEEIQNLDAR